MQVIFGALIVVVGITMLVAGARGSGSSLFSAVTGVKPTTTSASTGTGSGAVLASQGIAGPSAGQFYSSPLGMPVAA